MCIMMSEENQGLGAYTNYASTGKKKLPPTIVRYAMQSAARKLLPTERVATCLRFHAPHKTSVTVHRVKGKNAAYYGGLMVCGSVWHCPVCASRISEERKQELQFATNHWTGGILMATYTASHNITTSLQKILGGVLDGHRRIKSGRWYKDLKEKYGILGSVKALEITYTENGWHPHIHELIFFTNTISTETYGELYGQFRARWIDVLGQLGFFASTDRGFVLSDAHSLIAEYVTKWGHDPAPDNPIVSEGWNPAAELTKAVIKKGRKNGATPSQLLLDYALGDVPSGIIWKEYANTLKGRNQLVWSGSIRNTLKMPPERENDAIASEINPSDEIYASLNSEQWRFILSNKMRGEIILKASRSSQEEFALWLGETLRNM